VSRLLVAARPRDLAVAPYDAFVNRRHRILEILSRHYQLRLVLLRADTDKFAIREDYEDLVVGYTRLAGPPDSRLLRLAAAGRVGVTSWAADGERLADLARRSGADRSLSFGPWLDVAFQPLWSVLPSLHFFEEDLRRMPENAPQSRQAMLQRTLEDALVARAGAQPRVIVTISRAEAEPARRRFPKARLLWHPYTLDPKEWPLALDPSHGARVLVVGQFAEARNAEGLRDVLDALAGLGGPELGVVLVSGAGVHPCLEDHMAAGRLRRLEVPGPLYDVYRSSLLTLVPARRVTGIKTTVLQSWSAGTPVVCFPASAATLGGDAAAAAAVGETPVEVARLLVSLGGDPTARDRYAAAGRRQLRTTFDPGARDEELLDAIAALR